MDGEDEDEYELSGDDECDDDRNKLGTARSDERVLRTAPPVAVSASCFTMLGSCCLGFFPVSVVAEVTFTLTGSAFSSTDVSEVAKVAS